MYYKYCVLEDKIRKKIKRYESNGPKFTQHLCFFWQAPQTQRSNKAAALRGKLERENLDPDIEDAARYQRSNAFLPKSLMKLLSTVLPISNCQKLLDSIQKIVDQITKQDSLDKQLFYDNHKARKGSAAENTSTFNDTGCHAP